MEAGTTPPATDDPFADTQGAADDPFASTAPATEPPIVDKEGERVQADASPAETPAQPPVETPEPDQTAPEPQPPVEQPEEAPEPPVEAEAASDGAQPPQEPPTANGTGDGAQEDPPAEEQQSAKQMRLYKLVYQTGPTTWEESQIPDEYAEVVDGQRFLKARNNDHARKIAWMIHDRPAGGITILPVPASSWKPKRIKPAPPAPERERLVIE